MKVLTLPAGIISSQIQKIFESHPSLGQKVDLEFAASELFVLAVALQSWEIPYDCIKNIGKSALHDLESLDWIIREPSSVTLTGIFKRQCESRIEVLYERFNEETVHAGEYFKIGRYSLSVKNAQRLISPKAAA